MNRTAAWILIVAGLVLAVIGVFAAWEAILHNNIIARRFRNPWPGYLMVAGGIVLVGYAAVRLIGARA